MLGFSELGRWALSEFPIRRSQLAAKFSRLHNRPRYRAKVHNRARYVAAVRLRPGR